MSGRTVVIDTNVVVAGLLTGDAASPVARILDGMLLAAFPFALSEDLLAEYYAVLERPALRRLHGLSATEIETLLTGIVEHAIVLTPGAGPRAPDPGDQLLWDLLAAKEDLILVTGDQALQRDARMRARVISPRDFLQG